MPPTVEDRLVDILQAIGDIDGMLEGIDFEQFRLDKLRRMATERYLEIICEAARKLPDEIKQSAPEIDWRGMNDFANLLRHAYHATNVDIVWQIIRKHLPPLKTFVEVSMRTSGN
jgi:uncharacterized protein with HEPN domain